MKCSGNSKNFVFFSFVSRPIEPETTEYFITSNINFITWRGQKALFNQFFSPRNEYIREIMRLRHSIIKRFFFFEILQIILCAIQIHDSFVSENNRNNNNNNLLLGKRTFAYLLFYNRKKTKKKKDYRSEKNRYL